MACLKPNGPTDPDLEPGFPVQSLDLSGTYSSGQVIHTLVGNLDSDPELEILATGLARGPLYAWNHDGSPVPGWPGVMRGAAYPALGELAGDGSRAEVFAGHYAQYGDLVGWSASGVPLPGWPRPSANYVYSPPAMADVDNDGFDEVFIGESDDRLHGYRPNGSELAGWPVEFMLGSQFLTSPGIADLDGDGDLDVISGTGPYLLGYDRSGSPLANFPVSLGTRNVSASPVIGDVDGDGDPEIVVMLWEVGVDSVGLFSRSGEQERVLIPSGGLSFSTAPALADMDGDGAPEIVVQTDAALDVWRGDGTSLPGWPKVWDQQAYRLGHSAPVVGDVDGDGQPDIVVVVSTLASGSDQGEVRVYDRNGNLHPRFPKTLNLGFGAVPAIADIDRDGRNEIIVTASYWDGFAGYHDKVWAFDLGGPPHGPVLWGQYRGGPRHQSRYAPQFRRSDLLWRHASSGRLMAWLMHGKQRVSPAPLDPAAVPDLNWRVAATGDLTGDGSLDVLFRHQTSGELALWVMEGTARLRGAFLTPRQVADLRWEVMAAADFNRDGKDDLLWRHSLSGQMVVWYMDGVTLTGGTFLTPSALADLGWKIAGAADFNGDSQPDLLWRHAFSGELAVWYMNGASMVGGAYLQPPLLADLGWKIVAVGDYNRDGRTDIAWQHISSGEVAFWYMTGITLSGGELTTPSAMPDVAWSVVGPR